MKTFCMTGLELILEQMYLVFYEPTVMHLLSAMFVMQ